MGNPDEGSVVSILVRLPDLGGIAPTIGFTLLVTALAICGLSGLIPG